MINSLNKHPQHTREVMKKTRGIKPILTDNKIVVSDYFTKSSYSKDTDTTSTLDIMSNPWFCIPKF